MSSGPHLDASRRQDFVFLFDVTDGNPNGDPDAGNLPRIDPETMQGLVTDVALKRRIRDYVDATRGSEERFKIYVQSGTPLNRQHLRAYSALGIKSTGSKQNQVEIAKLRDWMCANFYDIRMFGAVMTTSVNCGQVRGPIQMTLSRSIDPILPLELTITRVTVTRLEDMAPLGRANEGGELKRRDMGRKAIVPYGLYRGYGFFNAALARTTGANDEDLALFWAALRNLFDLDRSSTRGIMSLREIFVFSHSCELGDAPAHRLFERIRIASSAQSKPPRAFSDYEISVGDDLPSSVVLTRLIGA
jgi:CRISPR-associated protein Csd2